MSDVRVRGKPLGGSYWLAHFCHFIIIGVRTQPSHLVGPRLPSSFFQLGWQGVGIEALEWNHSIHIHTLIIHSFPVQFPTSRSHSNWIPHNSNSIQKSTQFPHKMCQIPYHLQFYTINFSAIFGLSSSIHSLWTVVYLCTCTCMCAQT